MGLADWIQHSGWTGLFLAIAMLVTVLLMVFWLESDLKSISVVAATFFLAALILYFPSVKSVKFGLLDAELQDRIDTAGATIVQLRAIATFSVKQTLASSPVFNDRQKAFATRETALTLLRTLGASEAQLDDSVSLFNAREVGQFASDLDHYIYNLLKMDHTKYGLYTKALEALYPNYVNDVPPADKWQALAAEYVPIDIELASRFKDLAVFQSTGELRRSKVFYAGPVMTN